METLVEQIAAWEDGTDDEQVTDEQRDRIAADLYHRHLPVLADIGVVDESSPDGRVAFGEHADELDVDQIRTIGTE